MEMSSRAERLACGTELGALVDQVAEGLSPDDLGHQASCEHCQAALAELEPLWGQVRELAREEVSVPATLVAIVMRAIRDQRAEEQPERLSLDDVIPRLVEHALLRDEQGTTRIADSVIANIVGRVVLATPGVRGLDRAGVLPGVMEKGGGTGGVNVKVDGHRVSAHLGLVVDIGCVIPDVAAAVRERVVEALRRMTGLETVSIDITVEEVRAEDT